MFFSDIGGIDHQGYKFAVVNESHKFLNCLK